MNQITRCKDLRDAPLLRFSSAVYKLPPSISFTLELPLKS